MKFKNSDRIAMIIPYFGKLPNWFDLFLMTSSKTKLESIGIHASETAWVGTKFDAELDNNGSIDDLYLAIKNLVSNLPAAT